VRCVRASTGLSTNGKEKSISFPFVLSLSKELVEEFSRGKIVADLDRKRIATTALAVVDKVGMTGFSMRAVANALGVTPMALYHHVRDKAELITVMMDVANSEFPLPPSTDDWREDLWCMARMSRQSMLAHPQFMHLRRVHRAWTPSVLRLTERWVTLWQQSGLNLANAARAAAASSMAVIGLVREESMFHDTDKPDPEMLSWLPGARTLFDVKIDPATQFEMAVRALIDGLHKALSQEQSSKTAANRHRVPKKKTRHTTGRAAGAKSSARRARG
jgi:AcrR family transcriptional regulator